MVRIVVTGAKGQAGQALEKISVEYPELAFSFLDKGELDITNAAAVEAIFNKENFDYCINCAAYTNVEQSEKNPEPAMMVNVHGVQNLVHACLKSGVCLIHISTDYVFDGKKKDSYTVDDEPNPINVYGRSKWKGEEIIRQQLQKYYILRTSWLYSEYGHNFRKAILEKARTGNDLYVTDKQRGCPTHAENLARHLLDSFIRSSPSYGTYHFTDGVPMTWFEFAERILEENQLLEKINLYRATEDTGRAPRPLNSVLENTAVGSEGDVAQ